MRVEEIKCFAVAIPTPHAHYMMSRGRKLEAFESVVVKVTCEDGTVGFGEACTLGSNYLDGFPASVLDTIRLLANFVFECDVFEANVLVDGMDELVIGNLSGKAAIDVAMWDLRGKLLNRPVAQLLGGVKQRSFARFKAVSLASPQEMADEVREATALGYRGWQLKIGDDPIEDAARVHAVAEAVPSNSSFMTCDANKGWTVAQTLRFANAIKDVDTYIEQPCATIPELAQIHQVLGVPIMIDESVKNSNDVLDALSAKCADAINLKIVRVGGLTKAARIRDLVEAAGWMVLVDEPQGADLATASIAQLAATIEPRNFLGAAYFMGEEMKIAYQDPAGATGPRLVGGTVHFSDQPGLGIEIDEQFLGEPVFTLHREKQ